jgi:hypothetical protein
VKFKDADLIGIPLRIVIGGKGLKEGVIELKPRASKEVQKIAVADAPAKVAAAGHLPSLSSGDGMGLGGICLPQQWVEVDFSVTSSIYPSRWQDWFADADTEAEKGVRVFPYYYWWFSLHLL